MIQKTVYLSLTIKCNGQSYTLPLTPLLLALFLMAAFPLLEQTISKINQIVLSTDIIIGALVVGLLALVMSLEVKLCYPS